MAANDYITTADIKAAMPDETWGSTYDTLFALLATRASRAIDRMAEWWPGAFNVTADSTRYFDGSGNRRQWIEPLCADPTEVAFSQTGSPVDADFTVLGTNPINQQPDYLMQPYNALQRDRPYYTFMDFNILFGRWFTWYAFPRGVRVKGKFGFSTTLPGEIAWLTTIQAVRWFKRAQAAFADTGGVVDLGKLTFTRAADPEVVGMLDDHFRYPRL